MVAGAGQTPPEILPQARVLHRIQCNLEVQDCIHNLTLLWCAWSTCFWLPRHLQRVTDRIWTGYHLAIDCNNDPCPMPSWFPCLLLATTSYTVGANTTDFQAWKAAISAWLQQPLLKALTPVQCWCNIACALLYSWRLYHPISHLLLCLCVHLRLEHTRRPQAGHRIRQVQEAQQAEPPRAVTSESPQARPARRAVTGLRPDQLGRGQDRPVQALRARTTGEHDSQGPAGRKRDKQEKKREKRRRPKADDVRHRVGQACCWRSQRRAGNRRGQQSAARWKPSWTNQLISGNRNKERPYKLHYVLQEILASMFWKSEGWASHGPESCQLLALTDHHSCREPERVSDRDQRQEQTNTVGPALRPAGLTLLECYVHWGACTFGCRL